MSIDKFNFSVRTRNSLKRGGVRTEEQLRALDGADLMKLRGFGTKALNEVQQKLKEEDDRIRQLQRQEPVPPERFCVQFRSEIGTADNCICNACHHIGYVIKLEVPETTYNKGGKLKTKYSPLWLCRNCRDKLVNALKWEVAEDGN